MGLYDIYFDRKMDFKPYEYEEEYWQDLFAILDMRISVLCAYRLQKADKKELFGLKQTVIHGLFVSPEEALASLELERSRWSLDGSGAMVKQEINLATSHIMDRLTFTCQKGAAFLIRRMFSNFGLNDLEQFLFLLSMAVYYDARYEALFTWLQGDGKNLPTLRLAFSLYELTDEIAPKDRGMLLEQKGSLFEYLVIGDATHHGPPTSRMMILSKRIYTFMLERRFLAPELESMVKAFQKEMKLPAVHIRHEEIQRVSHFIECYANAKDAECHILHLYGENGNGKRFTVKHAAQENGYHVLFVDVSQVIDGKIPEINLVIKSLKLECLLTHSILCFIEEGYHADEEENSSLKSFPPTLNYLLELLSKEMVFFIWMTEDKAGYLTKYPLHFMAFESRMLSVKERITLWNEFSKEYPIAEEVDLILCANQYILTAQGIKEVLIRSEMMRVSKTQKDIQMKDILSSIKQQSINQLGKFATLINSVFTWDDLVIDEEQKRQMQMICDQVRYRNIVGEEWGFHKKTPYGRGICAMFYGSPGTGKTMAVQVIANELGLDLYRIDLSQMVSKYIGETEKNISTLFRKAKNINALLFFDEADSLFAKRSEVRDSNDRNANAETAHLLQKLEDYNGITILATNYANNIDDAFKRRIKFMINFIFPSEEVRYRLWTTIIPKKVVYDEEIDFEFFARAFELSGSNIKEILTNAAYIAAARHRGLTNADIVEAIKLNFAKYGKILTSEDFGYLG